MTTAVPTTPVVTTLAPTTVLSTTVVPTTIVSTVPPTTIYGETIDPGAIEIRIGQYFILHVNPPAPVNEGLNQEANWGPIEISMSLEGVNGSTGIAISPINMAVVPYAPGVGIVLGKVITPGAINIVVMSTFGDISVGIEKCNFLKWSKIGELDFTVDESNIAGERPLDWKGCIWHVLKLDDKIVAYGDNGVSIAKFSGVHLGLDTIYQIGLKNKGAFVGTEREHFFVDKLGQFYQLDSKFTKLDYSEFFASMGTIILTMDIEKRLIYICDGVSGYVYGIDSKSLGIGPVNVTGFGAQGGSIYPVSSGEIVTPKFEMCTDIYDLGTRNGKTIREIEVGTDITNFLYASIDYRTQYDEPFKQIGWFLVNPDGRAHPRCYGSEFRFRLMSTVYEYFELDYLKVKGYIHAWLGFTYEGNKL